MLKNIRNYSALFLLSLAVLANTVWAGTTHSHRFGPVKIDAGASGVYTKFLTAGQAQAYSITIREDRKTTVKIKSGEGVSIKLYLPSGEVKEYREDKSFNIEFQAAGEYVVEVHSASFSKYTLTASSK